MFTFGVPAPKKRSRLFIRAHKERTNLNNRVLLPIYWRAPLPKSKPRNNHDGATLSWLFKWLSKYVNMQRKYKFHLNEYAQINMEASVA